MMVQTQVTTDNSSDNNSIINSNNNIGSSISNSSDSIVDNNYSDSTIGSQISRSVDHNHYYTSPISSSANRLSQSLLRLFTKMSSPLTTTTSSSSSSSSFSNNDSNNNNIDNHSNISSTSSPTSSPSLSSVNNSSSNKDRPIPLPNQSSPIKHFALDIGGTLAKLVYFVQNNSSNSGGINNDNQDKSDGNNNNNGNKNNNELGGKLHFIKFQTKNIEDCFNFILENKLHLEDGKPKVVRVTGGGAYKYADLFEQKLGCTLVKEDEMFCLIKGTNFLLNTIRRESFTYSPVLNNPNPKEFVDKVDNPYPYLLVQIGSGVSVIKVDSETSYQRVDGTSLGGGTFWGLCSLLTGVTDFDEMLELTKHGQSNRVDLVVGDIYGTDYSKVGLSSDTIASSFGKIIYNHVSEKEPPRKEDIAQSLLKMVSNNIGQIAYLNSQRYGLSKIYFGGFFIRDHPNTMQRISFAIDFWSKGKTKAMFLVHDGYLGALGAFLGPEEEKNNANDESWLRKTTREFSKLFWRPQVSVVVPATDINQVINSHSNPTTPTSSVSPLRTSNNGSGGGGIRTSNSGSHHINKIQLDDEMVCDCGCQFCEGLVCKMDNDLVFNDGNNSSSSITKHNNLSK